MLFLFFVSLNSFCHRTQFGSIFLHLAVNGVSPSIRRDVHTTLEATSVLYPKLTNSLVRDAITAFLLRGIPAASSDDKPWDKRSRLSGLLLSTVSFGKEVDVATREDAVVDSLIVANHVLVCMYLCPSYLTKYESSLNIDNRWILSADVDRYMPKG